MGEAEMRHRILSALVLFPFLVVPALADSAGTSSPPEESPQRLPPGWYARIDTTMGRIVVRLLPEQAPQAVAQFVALAEGKVERHDPVTGDPISGPYYDGTEVYLAKAGIRFEAGDPTSTGGGGPPLWVDNKEGQGPVNFYTAGRIGLNPTPGRGASPYSFFITASAQPQLTGIYPCFGSVVEGRGVVERITEVTTHRDGRPMEPIHITRVRIFTEGEPPPLAEPVSYRMQPRQLSPRPRPTVE